MSYDEPTVKYNSSIFEDIIRYFEGLVAESITKSKASQTNRRTLLRKAEALYVMYDDSIPDTDIEFIAKKLDIRVIIHIQDDKILFYNKTGKNKTFHFIKDLVVGDITILQLYNKRTEDNVVLTLICNKFGYDPTPETLSIVREKLKHREYGYKMRDAKKIARYIQIRDIVTVEDYIVDMRMYDPLEKSILYNEGKPLNKQEQLIHDELQKIQDLNGRKLKSISPEDYKLLEECIANTKQPIWIASLAENKLLVTESIECLTISFNDLCKMILDSDVKCKYCNITMSLIHEGDRPPTTLTIDAVYPMYGHRVDNTVLCCLQCNIRKGMNYAYDPADKIEHCV
jgi:hypothetical protein